MRATLGAVCLYVCLACAPAQAAQLRVELPANCGVTQDGLQAQVERLIGRALSEVDALDVDVRVRRAGAQWKLVLRTQARPRAPADGATRARQISGSSCAEVTDAAAVAIALAIEGHEPASDEAPAWTEVTAEQEPSEAAASSATTPATLDSSSAAPQPPSQAQAASSESSALRVGFGGGLLLDAGALPSLAVGGSLAVLGELSFLRAELFGALFVPQRERLADGRGGEFELALGGAHACAQGADGAFAVLGCVGFELGQLSGRGLRVRSEHPSHTGWRAIDAQLGASFRITRAVAIALRIGATRPLSRPEFVLDGAQAVHRASAFGLRAQLGAEIFPW